MNTMKIKKGDQIIVIAGSSKDKGKKGKVFGADPDKKELLIDGINMQKHHRKARNAKETSGIINEAGPVDVSNVMVICPVCGKPTRVGYAFDKSGKKYRVCKQKGCNANIDAKAKEKTTKAKKSTAKAEKPAKVEESK